MHTAEPLVSEFSYFMVEIVTERLKNTNLQVLTKFRQNCSNTLRSEIHRLINSVLNKEECHYD